MDGWPSQRIVRLHRNSESVEQDREYDVAISFAGEERNVAREIAEGLRGQGLRVFYDEFEKYPLWGKNLLDYFTNVYFSKAKYCILLISENYVRKVWTQPERQAMQARAVFSQTESGLPVRLDQTEVPGLLPTVGYLNYHEVGISGIIDGVMAKFGKDTK